MQGLKGRPRFVSATTATCRSQNSTPSRPSDSPSTSAARTIRRTSLSFTARFVKRGRLLNHTITRPNNDEPSHYRTSFINRYVFPDGELSGPGYIMSAMNDAGFEIRHEENLREHYALTLKHWCENLEDHWDESVAEAGLGIARVWRLYLAASRLGFDLDTIQLHQTLGVKLGPGDHPVCPFVLTSLAQQGWPAPESRRSARPPFPQACSGDGAIRSAPPSATRVVPVM